MSSKPELPSSTTAPANDVDDDEIPAYVKSYEQFRRESKRINNNSNNFKNKRSNHQSMASNASTVSSVPSAQTELELMWNDADSNKAASPKKVASKPPPPKKSGAKPPPPKKGAGKPPPPKNNKADMSAQDEEKTDATLTISVVPRARGASKMAAKFQGVEKKAKKGAKDDGGDPVQVTGKFKASADDDNDEDAKSPWMDTKFLEMYQVMRTLEKDHKVPILVPEFLFFGFQSSGKTSTLSVVSGVPAGTMKDGTGTRCPVRYTMINDPTAKQDIITCQGVKVKDYEAQVEMVCAHMSALNDKNSFSAEIYEVTMTSQKVPNMIFVDMPGMLRNDQDTQFAEWKRQLESITLKLLGKKGHDGESFSFIPVFVKAAHDKEDEDPVMYIDHLLKQVRPRWKEDALFIVNKFDRSANFEKAEQFIEYMEFMSRHGQTVFTSTNPKGAHTSRMDAKELTEHIKGVPDEEDQLWEDILYSFDKLKDPQADKLRECQKELAGVRLQKSILKQKMIDIVRTTLPFMQTQLNRAKSDKEDEIQQLQTELQLGDPQKIRALVEKFNIRYLAMIREFYSSRDHGTLPGIRRGWKEEMDEFHKPHRFTNRQAKRFEKNKYYVDPMELKAVFKHVERHDLKDQVNMRLTATASIKRLLDFWTAMVALMDFPLYNDTDIFNLMRNFDGTIQSDPWETARNLVFRASNHLKDGCIWLAECLRYHFKTNADLVFDEAVRELEETAHYTRTDTYDGSSQPKDEEKKEQKIDSEKAKQKADASEKLLILLRIGKEDYDRVVDNLIADFVQTCEHIPNDQTECLDKKFVATALYYSDALNNLWNYATTYQMDHTDRVAMNWEGMHGGKPPILDPNALGAQQSNQMLATAAYGDTANAPINPAFPKANQFEAPQDPSNPAGAAPVGQAVGDEDGGPAQPNELARPAGARDMYFYSTLYPRRMEYQFPMSYENDVEMIYNLARVQWSAVKKHVIFSVQQQFGHRLMKEMSLRGKEQMFGTAMLQGVDAPVIRALTDKLTRLTNIPSSQYDAVIEKSPIPPSKSVMQMTDEELMTIYGKEVELKKLQLKLMLEEYKNFLDTKILAENKIEEMKRIEFSF